MSITPGALVRLQDRPDWGLGQVQSAIGRRVTVNFPEAGKVVLDLDRATLDVEVSAEEVEARQEEG
ncbi:MAG: DUF3553 domain-containing protein [Geminicoccaceae bacterium]|nr:DUF3553 domain-containing protein [Geminicoccaceae bacterium]